jgi:cyanophycin synthetase
VGRAIVDHLFPDGNNGRIPVVGVAGTQHGSLIARLVAWLLHLSGSHVGVACADGFYLDRRCVQSGDCANFDAGQRVLINRVVEAAVFENGPRMMLAEGLAYDRCTVGIVTDLGEPDSLAEFDIRDKDQLYTVVRSQVDVVMPDGAAVLNADDPDVVEMAALCDGAVVFYGTDGSLPHLVTHRANGGRAVLLREGRMVLAHGADERIAVTLADLPADAGLPPDAVLPALAAAYALGISTDMMLVGLESFATEMKLPAQGARPR